MSLGAPTVFREQSHKTVLIREPPNGSSLSDDKLSDEAIHPACAPLLASLQRADTQGRNGPRIPSQDIRKVSTAKTRISPERVRMAHSEASPSSTKLDAPLAPLGCSTGPPSAARKPLAGRIKPAKPSLEIVVPDS